MRGRSVDSSRHSRIVSSIDEMVRDLDRARPVLEAGLLCREKSRQQFLRAQALDPGRHLLAARRAHHGERARRDMAEAHFEHRRGEQRLDQHVARVARIQHAEQTSSSGKLWRELSASSTPSSIADAWISKSNDWHRRLRIARPRPRLRRIPKGEWMTIWVPPRPSKKRSTTTVLLVGNRAERVDSAPDVVDGLRRRALRHRAFGHQPALRPTRGVRGGAQISWRRSLISADIAGERPPASVSQNGSVGAIPGAGSTIRRPREMR